MSIFFLNDHGDVIFNDSDGKVYTKVGPTIAGSPELWEPTDVPNIQGFFYLYGGPDAQGIQTYSAEQMAVAENLYHVRIDSPVQNQWYTMFASAPVSGVLRYGGGHGSSADNARLRINGSIVDSGAPMKSSNYSLLRNDDLEPWNIAAGTLVEMMWPTDNAAFALTCGIIPFTYP